jgi:DNA-binding NarL/FixJ family response regulator
VSPTVGHLSEKEVAAELNVAPGTVKSLNSRALEKLRVTLNPTCYPASTLTWAKITLVGLMCGC